MKSAIYLIFLIMVTFGGGYIVLNAYSSPDETTEAASLGAFEFDEKALTIGSAVPATLDTGQRLDVVITAKNQDETLEIVPQVFALCEALAADARFKARLIGITELQLAFAHPGTKDPVFPVTLPIADGVCQ